MTPERLAEIKRVTATATPGPLMRFEDEDFLRLCKEAVPELVAEVERLRQACEAARSELTCHEYDDPTSHYCGKCDQEIDRDSEVRDMLSGDDE